MHAKLIAASLIAASLLTFASAAHAEPIRRLPTKSSAKRALPDYSGRGAEPASAAEAAVWPLRLVLSPLYFTSEFVLRRPIGALVTAAERADVPRKLYDFFAFAPNHRGGIIPVAFADFGFNPSVGAYAFWNDAFYVPHDDFHLHLEVWPDEWFAETIENRIASADDSRALKIRVTGMKRPDEVFYGTGPNAAQSNQSRYTEARFDAGATFEGRFWRSSRVETTLGVRKVDLSPGSYGADPSLEQAAASGAFALPFGFDRGYLAPYGRVYAALDTRRVKATTGSGVRIEVQSEQGVDVEHARASGFVRYGATASAFVDFGDHGRILGLTVAAQMADPVGRDPVPFTELVSLGGDKWMHGFFPGRLVDRSAAVAQLRYAWPIAPWLGGTMQAAVGNVFGEHLDGFKPELLRVSAAFGLTTTSNPPLELLVGFGTDTFEHGATVQSGRVSFGVPHSF